MNLRHLLPLLALSACPAPETGDDGVFFWRLTESSLAFGACTDDPRFRDDVTPFAIGENSFIIYRVSEDGKAAATLSCTHVDVSTCAESADHIPWEVAGQELTRSQTFTDSVADAGCDMQQVVTETLIDKGQTMTLDVVNVLTLINTTPGSGVCEDLDAATRSRSTNGFGVEGCVISRQLKGAAP